MQTIFAFVCSATKKSESLIVVNLLEKFDTMLENVILNGNDLEVKRGKSKRSYENEYQKLIVLNDKSYQLTMRRKWQRAKTNKDINREVLTAMLTVDDGIREDCVDSLLREQLTFNDLGALTEKDLELLGFTASTDRQYLLNIFKKLPKQDPSYDDITSTIDSQTYNEEILAKASNHLFLMRSALAGVNYKVQLSPPDDVLVGEKSFASRFIVEALTELKSVPEVIEKELDALHKIMAENSTFVKEETLLKGKKSKSVHKWFWRISLATGGVLAALCIWKWKKL